MISGGSIGIGLAIAEGLAQEGVHLALCARNADRVAEKAAEIAKKYGVRAISVGADVSKAEDVDRVVAETKKAFGGADFLICPANTAHLAIDLIRDRSPLPWLHIAEAVAADAERRGLKRLLLLGTRSLMEGPVYPRHLDAKGVAHEIPAPDDRARMNDIISGGLPSLHSFG